MAIQESRRPAQDPVERNTIRIDRLVHEFGRLIELLEEQRLVESTTLIPLKRELHEIQAGR